MLRIIHSSHLGIEKCKQRARDTLFWPAMSKQIEDMVSNCQICNQYRRHNTKEPLMPHPIPKRPWARVGADLCELYGKTYLIMVDYYSGFIEVDQLENNSSQCVIAHCKPQFARHGIPDVLITDGGPQFASGQFEMFSQVYQFQHCQSSPYYPQSNGRAEKAVQTAKSIIKKAIDDKSDPHLALLEYRNTPINDRLGSPTQRLMGRRTKTLIPTSDSLLCPQTIKPSLVQQELEEQKRKQKYYYDRNAHPLQELKIGDQVSIQIDNRWCPAVVTDVAGTPRSYIVATPRGQKYRRNRRHIIKRIKGSTHLDDAGTSDANASANPVTTPAHIQTDNTDGSSAATNIPPETEQNENNEPEVQIRRSSRTSRQPDRFDPTWV